MKVKIRSKSTGEVYTVTENDCTCADWKYRKSLTGIPCKHMQYALKQMEQNEKDSIKITISNGFDAVTFVEKYGESTLDYLKNTGEVYEKLGKLYKI